LLLRRQARLLGYARPPPGILGPETGDIGGANAGQIGASSSSSSGAGDGDLGSNSEHLAGPPAPLLVHAWPGFQRGALFTLRASPSKVLLANSGGSQRADGLYNLPLIYSNVPSI
jgi:hypothetical protein